MKEIKGVIVPILTPMREDGTINSEELVNQIERLIDAGIHGIFVLGTNGEGTSSMRTRRPRSSA